MSISTESSSSLNEKRKTFLFLLALNDTTVHLVLNVKIELTVRSFFSRKKGEISLLFFLSVLTMISRWLYVVKSESHKGMEQNQLLTVMFRPLTEIFLIRRSTTLFVEVSTANGSLNLMQTNVCLHKFPLN